MTVAARLREEMGRLARAHLATLVPTGPGTVRRRVAILRRALEALYAELDRTPFAPGELPDAAEWLLDNPHVVQDALDEVVRSLPWRFERTLPVVALDGEPRTRVEDLAREVRTALHAHLDVDAAVELLDAYQDVAALRLGELWAFPAWLRLLELETLAAGGLAADAGRIVRTLRALATADWPDFVERTSRLDRLLRGDPSGAYGAMDFETRDRYRREVERLARRTPARDELAVARAAVALASDAAADPGDAAGPRVGHVGTYLIAEGRRTLEARVGVRVPRSHRLGRAAATRAHGLYLGALALATGAALAVPLTWLAGRGVGALGWVVAWLVAWVPAVGIATAAVDWLATVLVPTQRLPRMDTEVPVPPDARTLVALPILFHHVQDVANALEQLEAHFLGNQDAPLGFALLSDLADAPTRARPEDAAILAALETGVHRLNERHAPDGPPRFHLLHRERRWNPVDRVWMGWERKRGKLEELNLLITGRGATSIVQQVDPPGDLASVRYVLTLDADTRLPPGTVRELVAVARHPLHAPVRDPVRGDVTRGYTVLQPRLEPDPAAAHETAFARALAGPGTVDLYAHVVAHAHQDLFGEATYMGKGLYDVGAFERQLRDRVPENRLLSHDLFEGLHGRVGFVSDVTVYEEPPLNALTHARRLHRWVRGDWQLLPWLVARHPPGRAGPRRRGLPLFARWLIADALRRSLNGPTILAAFVAAWVLVPAAAVTTTLAILALTAAPVVLAIAAAVRRAVAGRTLRPAVTAAAAAAQHEGARWAISLVLLPHLSAVVIDAIGRALTRVYVTRQRLLEWTTAASTARGVGATLGWRTVLPALASAPALAATLAAVLALAVRPALAPAAPLLLLWASAPAWAVGTSRPRHVRPAYLSDRELRELRLFARRTWHFFDDVVGPRDHWLPPDHLQEEPGPMIAHRTSPTNVGMWLASALAAYDLGFLGARGLVDRVRSTLDTLDGLERHHGHWLNWIDTRALTALEPRYVSTVDSGNLAAALLALARGLEEARHDPRPDPARVRGLADTLGVLADVLGRAAARPEARALRPGLLSRRTAVGGIEEALRVASRAPLRARRAALERGAAALAREAERAAQVLASADPVLPRATVADLRTWWERALAEMRAARDEIDATAPWLAALATRPPEAVDAAAGWREAVHHLEAAIADPHDLGEVAELAERGRSLVADLARRLGPSARAGADAAVRAWGAEVADALDQAAARVVALDADLAATARRCRDAAAGMDFAFLYDRARDLFHIGYHVTAGEPDPNHYDLLASEARIASLLAIAKGDAPLAHWSHLGRPLARVRGGRVLLSWSATAFEYLMPRLFLRHPAHTLLHESCATAVRQQRAFARRHGIPWGISESAYAELGTQGDYQYRAFGVPRLGLKRELGERLVVAPYASMLALPVAARAALENLERLAALGALGRYGFADAVDFGDAPGRGRRPSGGKRSPRAGDADVAADEGGPTRAAADPLRRWWRGLAGGGPEVAPSAVVRTYMAHHQGMLLVAAANHLVRDRMVERLHAEPEVAAVAQLLYERVPLEAPPPTRWGRAEAAAAEPGVAPPAPAGWQPALRGGLDAALPLSNGTWTSWLRAAGGGGTTWAGTTLVRDRPQETGGARGVLVYLRDLDDGTLWAPTLDPVGGDPASCATTFTAHEVAYRRRHGDLVAHEDVVVAAEAPLELRRVRVRNEGVRPRRVAVTSYAELVVGADAEDARHPAFAKMFVDVGWAADLDALVAHRRPREPGAAPPWWGLRLIADAETIGTRRTCTDRRAFLGRAGDLRTPRAPTLEPAADLDVDGAGLDPIAALGCVLELPPGATGHVTFVTAAGATREALALALAQATTATHVGDLVRRAEAVAGAELRDLGMGPGELRDAADLIALARAPRAGTRADGEGAGPVLHTLWPLGISGDLPVVLVHVGAEADLGFVTRVLRAHAWARGRQVGVDLVLLDEVSRGYERPLQGRLERTMQDIARRGRRQGPGGVWLVPRERVAHEPATLRAAAAVVLDAAGPPLGAQLAAGTAAPALPPAFVPVPGPQPTPPEIAPLPPLARARFAGYGGTADEALDERDPFDADDIVLQPTRDRPTPAPWSHVVAEEHFGFLVTDSGASTTWGGNSGERRLTPWPNDPVRDPSGEALYLRDEETGAVWSPTPRPAPGPGPYRVRYGAGFARFEHRGHGLEQRLETFVDPENAVKLMVVRLRDRWSRPRRLTVTAYVEWVLGSDRGRQAPFVVPGFDAETGTLTARTLLGPLADGSVAFLTSSHAPHGLTCDRREFLGPEGDLARPAGLARVGLSGAVRFGLDPCGALQVHVDLPPDATTEVHFVLGLAPDAAAARELAARFAPTEAARAARARVADAWRRRLTPVRVRTPDRAVDALLNRWAPYQALACRLWGRTALYQSSGAFGFRDQLQDAVNLIALDPALARAQLLRAAERQFEAGDVLHWWHPDTGAGVRTRCSDDLLWLPWAAARYVERTGDVAVLDERRPFLTGPSLDEGEAERYGTYAPGSDDGSLLEHVRRALARGDTRGPHGLPLIGSGDWNDGMNRLGLAGRGESVWLGWFLATALEDGAALFDRVGDGTAAARARERRRELVAAIEAHAWDGGWYLRATADDGSVIGSAERREARIDLIAQAWSVLSGAGDPERARTAMAAAWDELWRGDLRQWLLLAPPFGDEPPDPGYIAAYPPGVRENGGQYTHGALWGAWATAELGDGDRAVALLKALTGLERAGDAGAAERYRVEPYVVPADVYAVGPYAGRGGWTWYTGSAGWAYRFGLERVLGVRALADRLEVDPRVARDWPGYTVELRRGDASVTVEVTNPDGVTRGLAAVAVDGDDAPVGDDGVGRVPWPAAPGKHRVAARMGARPTS